MLANDLPPSHSVAGCYSGCAYNQDGSETASGALYNSFAVGTTLATSLAINVQIEDPKSIWSLSIGTMRAILGSRNLSKQGTPYALKERLAAYLDTAADATQHHDATATILTPKQKKTVTELVLKELRLGGSADFNPIVVDCSDDEAAENDVEGVAAGAAGGAAARVTMAGTLGSMPTLTTPPVVPGSWKSHIDPKTKKVYFYNTETNETSWTHPSGRTAAHAPRTHAKRDLGVAFRDDDVEFGSGNANHTAANKR